MHALVGVLQNNKKLVTYVIASGVMYGDGEHIMRYLFNVSTRSLYYRLLRCYWSVVREGGSRGSADLMRLWRLCLTGVKVMAMSTCLNFNTLETIRACIHMQPRPAWKSTYHVTW